VATEASGPSCLPGLPGTPQSARPRCRASSGPPAPAEALRFCRGGGLLWSCSNIRSNTWCGARGSHRGGLPARRVVLDPHVSGRGTAGPAR